MTLELFLILLIDNSITDIRVLYQRPKTGSLHFYSYYEIMSRDATQKGVNALNGLSSFLRIFRGIGYLCRTLFQALGWIIRNTFRMIPRVFNGSRRTFNQMGLNAVISNILAVIVVIAFVAIII